MVSPKTNVESFAAPFDSGLIKPQKLPWLACPVSTLLVTFTFVENIKETGSREHYYARLFSHGQKLGDYDP